MPDRFCPCGKKLVLKYKRDFSRKKFCSAECRLKYFPRGKMEIPDHRCRCGKRISDVGLIKTLKRKYCSKKCHAEDKVGSKRTWGTGVRKCVKCESTYSSTSTKQKWCLVCCPTLQARRRLQRYNLSQPEFDRMLETQRDQCPICKRSDVDLVVDHDHSCCPGTDTCGSCIRGLLCHTCNRLVGMIEASNHLFADAMVYLQEGV